MCLNEESERKAKAILKRPRGGKEGDEDENGARLPSREKKQDDGSTWGERWCGLRKDEDDLVLEHHAEVGLGQDEVDRVGQGAGPRGGNGGLEGLAVPRPARGEGASGCTASFLRRLKCGLLGGGGVVIVRSNQQPRSWTSHNRDVSWGMRPRRTAGASASGGAQGQGLSVWLMLGLMALRLSLIPTRG